jgi:hypothetical protein
MNAWFDDFAKRCAEIAARHNASIEAPRLEADVSREVLDLTRVVAHTSERQFAPLAAFIAGRAVERMAAVRAGLSGDDASAFIAELKSSLEVNEPA